MALTGTSWAMRALRVEGEWTRGTARILEEELIEVLDDERLELYDWSVAEQLPYDLAAIRHPADILGFVRKWGVLYGEDDVNEYPLVSDFMQQAVSMNWLLYRYALVRPGTANPKARRQLAEYWVGVYTGAIESVRRWVQKPELGRNISPDLLDRFARGADYEEMAIDVREALEEDLWGLIETTSLSIRSLDFFDPVDGEPAPPGDFLLVGRPPNLLVRAYVEAALEMTAGVQVSACPVDGRIFPIRDPRQVYCSPQCAGRARYHRFARRKKSQL